MTVAHSLWDTRTHQAGYNPSGWPFLCDAKATPVYKPSPNNSCHSHQNTVNDTFPCTQKHCCIWTWLSTTLASKIGKTSLRIEPAKGAETVGSPFSSPVPVYELPLHNKK